MQLARAGDDFATLIKPSWNGDYLSVYVLCLSRSYLPEPRTTPCRP